MIVVVRLVRSLPGQGASACALLHGLVDRAVSPQHMPNSASGQLTSCVKSGHGCKLLGLSGDFSAMTRPSVHPGEVLHDELQAIGVKPSQLARQIDVPANRISQIINGKRAITGDTALRLAHWFRTSPEYWLNLQSAFELRMAEETSSPAIQNLPTRPVTPSAETPRAAQAPAQSRPTPSIA